MQLESLNLSSLAEVEVSLALHHALENCSRSVEELIAAGAVPMIREEMR